MKRKAIGIKCTFCKSIRTEAHDTLPSGVKRRDCKDCGERFHVKPEFEQERHEEENYIRVKAIQLYLEGLNRNQIGMLLDYEGSTISKLIKPFTDSLEKIRLKKYGIEKAIYHQSLTFIKGQAENHSGMFFEGKNKLSTIWGVSRKKR
jgi:transposase-like protein